MIRDGIRRVFSLALRRRDRWERDVEDEIKLHLTLRAEQLAAQGFGPDDAYAEAVRRFGPLDESRARLIATARHRERNMARTEFLADLRQDVRFAVRTLRRQKAWTAVTIATLALGIGATTAVFSVVSPVLLHPLPYPHADRMVFVNQQPPSGNNTGIRVTISPSADVIRAWRANAHDFEELQPFSGSPMSMATTSGEPSTIQSTTVLPSFFRFAGARVLRGRPFTDGDIAEGGRVALLGEAFWRQRFAADSSVLGKRITLDDTAYTIIGVLPASLQAPRIRSTATDVWLPLDIRPQQHRTVGAAVIGRLRPGVSLVHATAELDSIYTRDPALGASVLHFTSTLTTPDRQVYFRDSLLILAAAVALVLLVACANVAHLLIARATTRQREMAIRAALGAGRGRQMRQLITETLLLAFAGTAAGVFVGWLGLRALVSMRPSSLDPIRVAHLDGTTLGIAVAVMLVSGVVFGLIGGRQSARASTHDALKAGATAVGGASRGRGRNILIVSEMALSAALLVMATLLIRSVINLQRADLGFRPEGLYSIDLRPLSGDLTSKPQATSLAHDYATRIAMLPGVQAVTYAGYGPGSRAFLIGTLEVEGETVPPANAAGFIDYSQVAPNYFRVMGIPMKAGTMFSDTSADSREVLINDGFARRQWGNASAIGHRIRLSQQDKWLTIVGVVGDTKTSGAQAIGNGPALYFPWSEPSDSASAPKLPTFIVRTATGAAIQALATRAARDVGLHRTPQVQSVAEMMRDTISGSRYIMLLLTIFASMAVVLAAVGLYGVMAYTVSQRTREIGIRIALGAPSARIARSVIVRGVVLALIGSALGLAGALWGTRLVQSSLYGVTRNDPWSLAAGVIVLALAAVLACVVPTRRALAVDPMTAIRAE
ncbi:MAG TPA: ABC transporter permease [Gemmatimonadaceae bacterium]|nr:ABC transporter permease [Gemmatimonadaceae bacterium]